MLENIDNVNWAALGAPQMPRACYALLKSRSVKWRDEPKPLSYRCE